MQPGRAQRAYRSGMTNVLPALSLRPSVAKSVLCDCGAGGPTRARRDEAARDDGRAREERSGREWGGRGRDGHGEDGR